MEITIRKSPASAGFSFVEVCIAIVVCVIFGAAAFATNQRLLVSLKTQKEETAASMMLQERMEAFRAVSYSKVADPTYVMANILTYNPSPSPSPTPSAPPGGQYSTWSEGPLGSLKETVTVSGLLTTAGGTPVPTDSPNQWIRDMTATGVPVQQSSNTTLANNYDLIKVDIQVNWNSANGRTRTRELAAVFGKGNIGQ